MKTKAPPPPEDLVATRVQAGAAELVVFEWPVDEPLPQAPPGRPRETTPLSPREEVVADLVARGYQNLQIAANLGVSVHTVRHQVASILRKTGTLNRTDFTAWWLGRR